MRKEKTLGLDRKRLLLSRDHLTVLGSTFGADSISEEVSIYGFPEDKHCVHCLLCLIVVFVILSIKRS